jgi:hydroxylamine reductase
MDFKIRRPGRLLPKAPAWRCALADRPARRFRPPSFRPETAKSLICVKALRRVACDTIAIERALPWQWFPGKQSTGPAYYMFCYQCEQTSKGKGCVDFGVCGKDEHTAILQDLLVYAAKGIAQYAHRARLLGARDRAIDVFVVEALFTTVTNVNFDADRIAAMLQTAARARDTAKALYETACAKAGQPAETLGGPAAWIPAPGTEGLLRQAKQVSVIQRREELGEDIAGLQELLTYGVKGTAAYADHAWVLGAEDEAVFGYFHEALDFLTRPEARQADALLAMNLRCGEVNLKVMEMLDAANTGAYGHPVPTPVRIEPVKGKAILVSGHDLKDLELLLKQTAGKGINVYTHGEMLPAHGYPKLKAYPHLAGNYGGAWQDQKVEFAAFPGAILMTTNCIQEPQAAYAQRIFTSGLVAWPGTTHVSNQDFTPVIEAALAAPGFDQDGPDKTILVGFGHQTVMSVADQVVAAVKQGAIKRFFLVGGCDGAKVGRDYYTEFAEKVPADCVILTLACGKYRFNKLDFGAIGGIPRLLDIGQCNDAYSAVQIAVALAKAFNCGVNDLPLSFILSWYEQKAVCILLTLLHLGIRNLRLGPSLPAFLTPPVVRILVDKYNLMPITTPDKDLEAILA